MTIAITKETHGRCTIVRKSPSEPFLLTYSNHIPSLGLVFRARSIILYLQIRVNHRSTATLWPPSHPCLTCGLRLLCLFCETWSTTTVPAPTPGIMFIAADRSSIGTKTYIYQIVALSFSSSCPWLIIESSETVLVLLVGRVTLTCNFTHLLSTFT